MPDSAPAVTSLGKLRRLQRISDADGFVRVAAIDHPENYLALFDADLSRVTDAEVVESKLELVAAMAPASTAVLLDPVWSLGQGVLSASVPGTTGTISGLEHLAYSPQGFGTETVLREGWDVATLARLGVDAAKLVVFYRPEQADVTQTQHELVSRLVAECEQHQLPLVIEPLWYPLEDETLDDAGVRAARTEAIVSSAAVFAGLGADVMKVEFPGYLDDPDAAADACARLNAGIDVPWVLLSASATYEQFRDQLRIAATAGACGFMAGRAIWGDAVGRYDAERRAAGARTAGSRLAELHDVLRSAGRGWQQPVPVAQTVAAFGEGWFRRP